MTITPASAGVSIDDYNRMMDIMVHLYSEIPPDPLTNAEREAFWDLAGMLLPKIMGMPPEVLAADYAVIAQYDNTWSYNAHLMEAYYLVYNDTANADGNGVMDRTEYKAFE